MPVNMLKIMEFLTTHEEDLKAVEDYVNTLFEKDLRQIHPILFYILSPDVQRILLKRRISLMSNVDSKTAEEFMKNLDSVAVKLKDELGAIAKAEDN